MSKKKGRIVNNIKELNLEIDYDKLAEALAKVQNRQSDDYSGTREWMKFLILPVYIVLSGILALISLRWIIKGMKTIAKAVIEMSDLAMTLPGIGEIVVGIFMAAFCALSLVSVREVWKEKDRQYIASLFSNTVAVVALIVAVIALLKE